MQGVSDAAYASSSDFAEGNDASEDVTPDFTPSVQEGENILLAPPSVPCESLVREDNFEASRKRNMEGLLHMAATGTQPAEKHYRRFSRV